MIEVIPCGGGSIAASGPDRPRLVAWYVIIVQVQAWGVTPSGRTRRVKEKVLFPVDIVPFIRTVGYIGVAVMVFAESGLLIGFFLPGDSLLFTAGFLASQGSMDIRLWR